MPPKESNLSKVFLHSSLLTAVQFIIFFSQKTSAVSFSTSPLPKYFSVTRSICTVTCQCIKMPKLQMVVLERLSYINDVFSTSLDWDVVLFKDILVLLINANVTLLKRWTCQSASSERKNITCLSIMPTKARTFLCVSSIYIHFKTQTNCSLKFQFGPKNTF